MMDSDALRTAEETEKEIDSDHDEHSLRGEGSPLTDPLRKDCLARTRRSSFICCCRHNFGAGSGKEEEKAEAGVVEPNTEKDAPKKHYNYLSSRVKVGLARKRRCFRPESGVEEHVICPMHQRTSE